MIRVFVLYPEAPGAERYARHAELCRRVPGAEFRHGRVLKTLQGEAELGYYAEFEFPDMESFQRAAGGEEFRATGKDAAELGAAHSVYLADVG